MIKMRRFTSHILQLKALTISKQIVYSLLLLLFLGSCNNNKPDKIGAIVDRTKLPKLHATEVTTIISDSGITRYRITASRWDVFDKSAQPYQEFPDGIYFEKFDPNMKVDANISSKYARFNENEQLWILRGKVRAMNLQGELFETEKLFWNQREQKFYSDTLIKITQSTRIITGIGFESNETMTHYMIKNPQGIFPLNENAGSTTPAASPAPIATVPKATAVPTPPVSQAVIPKAGTTSKLK
jgi:LPS export ABC transporter protein LptC